MKTYVSLDRLFNNTILYLKYKVKGFTLKMSRLVIASVKTYDVQFTEGKRLTHADKVNLMAIWVTIFSTARISKDDASLKLTSPSEVRGYSTEHNVHQSLSPTKILTFWGHFFLLINFSFYSKFILPKRKHCTLLYKYGHLICLDFQIRILKTMHAWLVF